MRNRCRLYAWLLLFSVAWRSLSHRGPIIRRLYTVYILWFRDFGKTLFRSATELNYLYLSNIL